ncbi:MAG: lycopene cyclase family protein, partial [Verrucomicrobiota bacterium]
LAKLTSSEKGEPLRIVVIEPRTEYEDDRTWCFWESQNDAGDSLVKHRWNTWSFSTNAKRHRQSSSRWAYSMVSGEDFYQDAQEAIAKAKGIELQLGTRVLGVESTEGGIEVTTSSGSLLASRVVDTRPPRYGPEDRLPLYQVFAGAVLETEEPLGDSSVAGLMEHMRTDELGFCFDYVLPLEENQWLFEVTRFCPENEPLSRLESDLEESLASLLPAGKFRVLRQEAGMIPMGHVIRRETHDPRWVVAGTGGGAVRAASGYAYRRIQKWSRRCARAFYETGTVIDHPHDSRIRRGMDALFLDVLLANPERTPELFYRLARRTRTDTLARFMMDEAGTFDLLSVILSLPPPPFLKQIYQNYIGKTSRESIPREAI